MDQLQRQAFRKTYGKIWDLAIIEVSVEAIASLTQYYDQPLRCFTFGDFQLVPTVEEFEEILGCMLGGRKPYLFFWVLSLHGENSQGSQNIGARVGPSKTKQKWDSQNTKEAFGGKGESVGESR